jgi:hypothetical protein
MPATASRPRSSATPSGCISASRSARAWSRICWSPAELPSVTRPCGMGAQIRPVDRQSNPPPAAPGWRQVASGREVPKIAGVKNWLWRAGDRTGIVLDVPIQRGQDEQAARRLLRKLSKKQMLPPRITIADKLASHGAAKREIVPRSNTDSTKASTTGLPTGAADEAVQAARGAWRQPCASASSLATAAATSSQDVRWCVASIAAAIMSLRARCSAAFLSRSLSHRLLASIRLAAIRAGSWIPQYHSPSRSTLAGLRHCVYP